MKKKKGFTLAEILITLTVIGIIAAITISILAENGRKTEVETKLKKTISVLNNALLRATIDYGAISSWPELNSSSSATSTTNFMAKYIVPYVITTRAITTNQDGLTMEDLGYKDPNIRTPKGAIYGAQGQYTAKLPRIFFNDGTVILRLTTSTGTNTINYLVDTNGPKGPNVMGKDVFRFALEGRMENPTIIMDGLIKVTKNNTTGEYTFTERSIDDLEEECADSGAYCGALIQKQGWKITSDYPIKM